MLLKFAPLKDLNKLPSFKYCSTKTTSPNNKNKLYSSTILLPKTKLPLSLGPDKLIERDKYLTSGTKIADCEQLYSWQRGHLSEPEFVLHDGPPYANGKPHMGHAINKILKDTIVRYKILNGNKVHYIPGWDCHGLPIELKALSGSNGSTALDIRSKARRYAKQTIEAQEKAFKSWGVVGDWTNAYTTYSADYIKTQLKLFYKLYKKDYIFKDFKPIYWSPSSRTALAEAELEYNDNHKSPSCYVRFKVEDFPGEESYKNRLFALIWTTTPWTLPSNQAICYNPSLTYSIVQQTDNNNLYIIAEDLLDDVSKVLNCNFQVLEAFSGDILSNCSYTHPVYKEKTGLKFYPGAHATAKKGTGLVHTAPAHGPDDFLIALANNIPIVNLVNDLGCYNETVADSRLEGKFVLSEGNETILQLIHDDLLHSSDYTHSYPYDWRTKKPVIIRASEQWFINTNRIKGRAIELLEDVEILPEINSKIYRRNLINQLEKRPYWCISRQRKWGVPIPVFYHKKETAKTDEILINEDIINHQCELIDNHGPDYWWKLPIDQLIPNDLKCELDLSCIVRGDDVLDIWFDSGVSWANVLEGDKVADLYLEGLDQFNGWFQSSLITSVALRNKAPFKKLYVHGFAVDERGMKMSKSVGNVVDPEVVMKGAKGKKAYGVDTLRWWVVRHANQDSIAYVSDNILQSSADDLQKIRSVLRFALGALNDYDDSMTSDDYKQFYLLDKYMLHLLSTFHQQVQESIDNYQFHRICILVINLLTNPISALYYTGIKDRLYCDLFDSNSRRSCQFVLQQIFEVVTQSIAPIVPHLIEEMYRYMPQNAIIGSNRSYFTVKHDKPQTCWNNPAIENVMSTVLNIKRDVNKRVGASTIDCVVSVMFTNSAKSIENIQEIMSLDDYRAELVDILQVADVIIVSSSTNNDDNISKCGEYILDITSSQKYHCERCRRVQSDCKNELCKRCFDVLKVFNNKKAIKS